MRFYIFLLIAAISLPTLANEVKNHSNDLKRLTAMPDKTSKDQALRCAAYSSLLSLGAKAMHQHREEILNMKTEIRRISDNLVIISEKKRGSKGGSSDDNT